MFNAFQYFIILLKKTQHFLVLVFRFEVVWRLPSLSWTKVNTDGSSMSHLGQSSCGGIFRNSRAFVHGCFVQ